MNGGRSNGYPMYGNSYNDRYSRTDGMDAMLEGLNDRDRMAVADYIRNMRG